jgi:hypothetical protein
MRQRSLRGSIWSSRMVAGLGLFVMWGRCESHPDRQNNRR